MLLPCWTSLFSKSLVENGWPVGPSGCRGGGLLQPVRSVSGVPELLFVTHLKQTNCHLLAHPAKSGRARCRAEPNTLWVHGGSVGSRPYKHPPLPLGGKLAVF